MRPEDLTGAVIDRFAYDTPTRAQADFYALCDDDRPLVMVFLPNFGHPISRVYLTRYMDSLPQLASGRLACVVRSDPHNIAAKLDKEYPFPLICDAAGVLYEYFGVQSTTSRLAWSFTAARIFREAKKQGYVQDKNTPQLLPLTLVVGRQGKVLFSHFGESVTDLPENCAAMEQVCRKLGPQSRQEMEVSLAAEEEEEPDLTMAANQVLFAGQAVPAAPAQTGADADHTQQIDLNGWADRTQQIDLAGWNGETAAEPEKAEAKDPRWNKLLGLFAKDDPEA